MEPPAFETLELGYFDLVCSRHHLMVAHGDWPRTAGALLDLVMRDIAVETRDLPEDDQLRAALELLRAYTLYPLCCRFSERFTEIVAQPSLN